MTCKGLYRGLLGKDPINFFSTETGQVETSQWQVYLTLLESLLADKVELLTSINLLGKVKFIAVSVSMVTRPVLRLLLGGLGLVSVSVSDGSEKSRSQICCIMPNTARESI